MTFRCGLDVLVDEQFTRLTGQRVGLLTNPSAVNRDLVSAYRLFSDAYAAQKIDLRALYAPEHGFAAAVADGEKVAGYVDAVTGVPVHSLYGETQRPTPDMLSDVDVIVVDIQDIGVRFYTFIWTMTYVLEAAGAQGVAVMILDRPNPLGDTVAGPLVEPEFTSIVGQFPVPITHGMTIGEMARMVNDRWNPSPCELSIVECAEYDPMQSWEQTGRPFIMPSPNMPHLSTVRHYPGSCLIEGVILSEGRGTALPFEMIGAPFIDGDALADRLNALNLSGVRFRSQSFTPYARTFAGEVCHGVQAHITDMSTFEPLIVWLSALTTIRAQYPDDFQWRPPYRDGGMRHFDRLAGSATLREMIDGGRSAQAIVSEWEPIARAFRDDRAPYLLYDRA